MVSEPSAAVRLARLAAEVKVDVDACSARAREIRELVQRWDREGALDRPAQMLIAVNLRLVHRD